MILIDNKLRPLDKLLQQPPLLGEPMTQKFLALALLFVAAPAFAESDLSLFGETYAGAFKGYTCGENSGLTATPAAFKNNNFNFTSLTTDAHLRTGLLLATFTENGSTCRYSVIVDVDAKNDILRIQASKAFDPQNISSCVNGKQFLDSLIDGVHYLYFGHPHNAALQFAMPDAFSVCGGRGNFVGPVFQYAGRTR